MNKGGYGRLMTADELATYLGITRNAAYTLLHKKDFPSVQIGNLLFAVRDEVDQWIKRQTMSGGYQYDEEARGR